MIKSIYYLICVCLFREWPSEFKKEIAESCYERAQCCFLSGDVSKNTLLSYVKDLDVALDYWPSDFDIMLQRVEAKYLLKVRAICTRFFLVGLYL